ncbi:MAG: hypothetical protein AAFY15_13655, partial [Cyanobacteria bacterium J06648_11]
TIALRRVCVYPKYVVEECTVKMRLYLGVLTAAALLVSPAWADGHEPETDTDEKMSEMAPSTLPISDDLDAIVLKQPPPENILEYPEYVVQRQYEIYQDYTRDLFDRLYRSTAPINSVDVPNPFAQTLSQQPGFYRVTGTEPTPQFYSDGE